MRNAIIYARFSPRPDGATCESIEMQRERCAAQCKAKGWPILSEHEDRELSGKRADNRPGLIAALKSVCQSKGVLVVYSLSRLSRSTRDCIDITDRLEKAGADLFSVNESLDTTTPAGRFMFTLTAALGQLEREQTSVRTADALARMRRNGMRTTRHPPYGYRLCKDDPKRIETDETEQEVIKRVLYIYQNECQSAREITKMIVGLGYKPRAGRWHHPTIRNILKRAEVWTPQKGKSASIPLVQTVGTPLEGGTM